MTSKTESRAVSLTCGILLCLDAERRNQRPLPWALADMHEALARLTDKQAEDLIAALTSALSTLDGEALVACGSDIARLEARDETAPDIAAEPIDGVLERPVCVDAGV